jgi:hypothetical protein
LASHFAERALDRGTIVCDRQSLALISSTLPLQIPSPSSSQFSYAYPFPRFPPMHSPHPSPLMKGEVLEKSVYYSPT